ncbi:MAG: hypothetical protein JWM41_3278 [Gemmatimonadetes bacterium]|nr:hypothetical protein [Gemmatimonadota bacterium]
MHNSRYSAPLWRRRAACALLALAALSGIDACSDSLRSIGPTPAIADTQADQLFEAFKTRFTQVELSPKYDVVRTKLAQAALVPSKIFGDDAVWEVKPSATTRLVYVSGTAIDGRYKLETRATPPDIVRLADSRHAVSLEQTGGSTYRWDTKVDIGIGSISAEGMSVLITSLLAAPEGRTERELRDDYRAAFPRAMAAFGRGFSVDSLHVAPGPAGTTAVAMSVGFHPDLMRPAYPALADYLDKYLGPAKYHFALSDHSGVALLDIVGRDRMMTVKYRVQGGKLTSLFGPPRPWADSLLLTSDVSLKVKIFTVGFHSMLTDFVVGNSGHERAWTVVAQHEPKWDLPFVAERLIRSPLRRPFEGAGTLFRLAVRDSAGAQSVFSRRTRLDVQESTIMRFLGGLASHAVGDIDTKVELDEHRFLREGFSAMQADLAGLTRRRSGAE